MPEESWLRALLGGGCWHLLPWVPLAQREGTGEAAWGHGQCGIAMAVAGMTPTTLLCRLRHLTGDKLNQALPERLKTGNLEAKFCGNRNMDPNSSWLLPRNRQGAVPGTYMWLSTSGSRSPCLHPYPWRHQAGAPEAPCVWKQPSPGELDHGQAALLIHRCKILRFSTMQPCCHARLGVMAQITLVASPCPCANCPLGTAEDRDTGLEARPPLAAQSGSLVALLNDIHEVSSFLQPPGDGIAMIPQGGTPPAGSITAGHPHRPFPAWGWQSQGMGICEPLRHSFTPRLKTNKQAKNVTVKGIFQGGKE